MWRGACAHTVGAMTPEFIVELRKHVGNAELWLLGTTAVVVRGPVGAEEVLLVKRADDGRWTPVTGIVDPGEEPDVTAVREVREETGLDVEVQSLLSVQVTRKVEYHNGDRAQYLDHAFLARVVGDGSSPHPADGENVAVRWTPLADVPSMGRRFDRTVELAVEAARGRSAGAVLFGAEERRR